ncbi:MAG: hypothetical protein ACKO2K_08615, partial [Alphaproteobacteria bacterium]
PSAAPAGDATVGPPAGDATATVVPVSPYQHRLLDFVFVVPRFLSGLTRPYGVLPGAARVWIPLEFLATVVPLVAAGWLASRTGSVREPGTLRLILATFVATILVPLALPTDVWCYYLDGRLVAGAIAVGVAVALSRRPWVLGAIAVTAACRTVMLAWWVSSAASTGWIPANLDYLRVGGPRPADLNARARLLTVSRKSELADVVLDTVGAVDRPLRWDLHGVGAEDFDTDNGYFLLREARERGVPEATGSDVLILPRVEVPPSWVDAFPEPRSVGYLDVFEYAAVVHPERGTIEGCGSGPLPPPPVPDPIDYGTGEPRRTAWPCADPIVRVPFDAHPDGASVRVFPRLSGPGRIEILSVTPASDSFGSGIPSLGRGVMLPASSGEIRLRLALEGPATLDMVVLHGRNAPVAPSPASPASPPATDTTPSHPHEGLPEALRADSNLATAGRG